MVDQQAARSAESGLSANLIAADGTRYELSGEQVLGRSLNDDITIPESNISRGHARLRVAEGQVTVEDLGSTNGTRVNRRRIDDVVILHDGDTVSFDTFDFRIEVSGLVDRSGAAMSGAEDATVVAAVSEPSPSSRPGPQKIDQGAPAGAAQVSGGWENRDDGTGTVIMYKGYEHEDSSQPVMVEHSSDLTHLIIFAESESGEATILELETGEGDEQDVWEVGRDENCSIVVLNDSVSARHAQLIYQDGRWRLVNLVSTNGIYINGEKRLTATLADGDEIKLGTARLIFKLGNSAGNSGTSASGAQNSLVTRLLMGLAVAAVAVGLWWFLK